MGEKLENVLAVLYIAGWVCMAYVFVHFVIKYW